MVWQEKAAMENAPTKAEPRIRLIKAYELLGQGSKAEKLTSNTSEMARKGQMPIEESVTFVEYLFEKGNKKDAVDLLKATFPGGSITGAPKIRSMEIIEELEPVRRGVYTGSIGYIGFDGRVDLNIAIRTLVNKDDQVYLQVGGGIVFDSNPVLEYEETLHKAKALLISLGVTNFAKKVHD